MIYPSRVLKLRVRGTKKDLIQDTSSEEFCLIMSGVIAHFDGSDIQVNNAFCIMAIRTSLKYSPAVEM